MADGKNCSQGKTDLKFQTIQGRRLKNIQRNALFIECFS